MSYAEVLGWVIAGRVLDMFSTWLATPDLRRESNRYARKIGWWGIIILNAMLVPLLAISAPFGLIVATASLLLAGSNCVAAMNWRYNQSAAMLLVVAMTALGSLFYCSPSECRYAVDLAIVIYALVWAGRHIQGFRRTVWLEKQRRRRAVRLQ